MIKGLTLSLCNSNPKHCCHIKLYNKSFPSDFSLYFIYLNVKIQPRHMDLNFILGLQSSSSTNYLTFNFLLSFTTLNNVM